MGPPSDPLQMKYSFAPARSGRTVGVVFAVFAVAFATAGAACSSTTGNTADGGADSSSADSSVADSSVADSSVADSSVADSSVADSAADTGADTAPADAGNACTNIGLAPPVFPKYVTAAAPGPLGGAIVDGTYHLTALTHYGAPADSTGNDPVRTAVKFTGSAVEYASQLKAEPEERVKYAFAVSGPSLTLTRVCPAPDGGAGGETAPYSATATTVTLYLDAEYVFTKQ